MPIPLPQPSPTSEPGLAALRLCVRRRQADIFLRVPTELDVVEEAVDLIARHCLAAGLTPHAARFNLRVALSEALGNAIRYGNQLDPAKHVDILVEMDGRRFAVHVSDEGNGFDPAAVPDPTLPERIELEDGRGLFLIRQLMDDVSFNDRGNAICMILRRA